MLQDVRAYDEARKARAAGEGPVPSEVTYAILDGVNPVCAWREHRSMSRKRLAEASGLTSYLSQVESGQRKPGPEALAAIAKEPGLEADDIMDS